MTQMERNEVITSFKKKEIPVMVATDVAGKNIMSTGFKKYQRGFLFKFKLIAVKLVQEEASPCRLAEVI
jgi:hypothetical protein